MKTNKLDSINWIRVLKISNNKPYSGHGNLLPAHALHAV